MQNQTCHSDLNIHADTKIVDLKLKIVTTFYLITKTKSHYSDEKAKESFEFPQAYKEKQIVSIEGSITFRTLSKRQYIIYIPYLSRKRNTNVSVMVMRTPIHSLILEKKQKNICSFNQYFLTVQSVNMQCVNL